MRKLFIVVSIFVSAQLLAGHVQTISKSVSDLSTLYGWKQDSCYLSFSLNDIVTITSTDGNAKYCSDKTATSLRYYQDCRKGEFSIRVGEGVTIKSIKLSYYAQADNSVVCTDWGTDGKSIALANQVKSDEEYVVDAEQIALYVGRTDANTGGQVRITAMEVTYVVEGGDPVLVIATQTLAEQYGWSDLQCPRNFDLNDVLKVDVDSAGTMKYTKNTQQMHCYQWLGGFTIRAKEGYRIKTVKLTYFSINSGVMTRNWGEDGKNIKPEDRIASDDVVGVYDSSVKFYVGTTGSNTDGQIRIKKWEIEYTEVMTGDSTYYVETFSQCTKKKMTEGFAYVVGDDAGYDWNLRNFSRDKQDTIQGEQGILLYYGGSIATNGVQEGGLKYLSFDWRAMDATAPVHMIINMGSTSMLYSQSAVGDVSQVQTYSHLFQEVSNTSFSISLRAKEDPAQSQIVVGELRIAPYLLFTKKYVELLLPQTTYDCASGLINNTDGEGEITYSIVSSTSGKATMDGSVLDLSEVSEEDEILVMAQWGEVTTTMTLRLTIPSGIDEVHNAQCTMHNGKVMRDGELRIWHDGAWWTVMGERMHNAQCTMKNEE